VDAHVRIPVRRGLVPALDELADEAAVVRDRHAEQEERRARSELVEQVEYRSNLRRKGGVRPVPVRAPETTVDELVPVLEVDAEQKRGLVLHAGDCM